MSKIIKEYQNELSATIPKLSKKYKVNASTVYRKLKEKGVILFKSGWNDSWHGDHTPRKGRNGAYAKRRSKFRKDNIVSLLKLQNHECAIYKKLIDEKSSRLDHCHKTNRIRGLLCDDCNKGIGFLKEDCTIMKNALVYIKNF